MNYKIKNTFLELNDGQLLINGKEVPLNHKTLLCIRLLLTSKNQPISKEQLLEKVWDGTIVSESSIFKQIQLIRKTFKAHGLPADVVESVYGTGYKIKYPIESVVEKAIPSKSNNGYLKIFALILLIIVVIAALSVLFFQLLNSNTIVENQLTEQNKIELEGQLKQDWTIGLTVINELLEQEPNKHYSNQDLGYLYFKKAEAELQLHKPEMAIASSQRVINQFNQQDLDLLIDSHIILARALSSNNQTLQAIETTDQAIELLGQTNQSKQMVTVLMTKALLLRKLGKLNESIKVNNQSLSMAKEIGDNVGELIAVNNLASTFQQNGDTKKAIELSHIGLQLALAHGTAQHISNVYNAITTLELEHDNFEVAIELVEQSLRYQLSSNNIRFLAPKLYNYLYIAIHTQKPEAIDDIFNLTQDFLQTVDASESTQGKFNYLQALNHALMGNWEGAQQFVNISSNQMIDSNLSAFKAKIAALNSLSNFYNKNHINAIELAKQVIENNHADTRSVFISNLALMLSYSAINQPEFANRYQKICEQLFNESWLFESIQYHNSSPQSSLDKLIINKTTQNILFDEEVTISLVNTIKKIK